MTETSGAGGRFSSYVLLFVFAAILLPFSAFGVYCARGFYSDFALARRSVHWPAVPAHIESSVLRHIRARNMPYRAEIFYTYTAEGRTFTGTRILPPSVSEGGSLARAQEMLRRFPAGSTARAYYRPGDPGAALLIPGLTATHYATAGVFVLWIALPPLLIVLFWWRVGSERIGSSVPAVISPQR